MEGLMAVYRGLRPLEPGAGGTVELETDRGYRDLHNDATLRSIDMVVAPRAGVRFTFGTSAGETLVLGFADVVGFTFESGQDLGGAWDPDTEETLYEIATWAGDAHRESFAVDTILGRATFAAAEVSVEWPESR
ncbi:hypothetical protein [Alloactinosynnema sp. L-07]|nr:hypothetical protein [Alloactinosynnema sp. L-07]